MLSGAESCAS
jgi:hypothetical protein